MFAAHRINAGVGRGFAVCFRKNEVRNEFPTRTAAETIDFSGMWGRALGI